MYSYHDNGDMADRIIQSNQADFNYNGNRMITADGNNLSYDENGQLTAGLDTSLVWNWDNKLRRFKDGEYVKQSLKYDPAGNCRTDQKKEVLPLHRARFRYWEAASKPGRQEELPF